MTTEIFLTAFAVVALVLPAIASFVDAFDPYHGNGWKDVARDLPLLAAWFCAIGLVIAWIWWG